MPVSKIIMAVGAIAGWLLAGWSIVAFGHSAPDSPQFGVGLAVGSVLSVGWLLKREAPATAVTFGRGFRAGWRQRDRQLARDGTGGREGAAT